MITLKNTTKSVKVFKAWGEKTLRIIPGYNYVKITKEEFKEKFLSTDVNKAIFKESIEPIDFELKDDDKIEAEKALELNEKLNKAQKVIDKQNKQILEKDSENDSKEKMIKEQGELIKELMKKVEKLEKKDKKEKKDK